MAVEEGVTAKLRPEQFNSLHLPARPSLYVGDLHPSVTKADLFEAFRGMGHILSVRLCTDALSGRSLCYGYVNFLTPTEASIAMDCLNHTILKGKPMRIMWSQRNPIQRKTGVGNLFVKNLDPSINSARLQSLFCKFGTVLSCKVAEDNGKRKGFGFVQFDSEHSAMAALKSLHDTFVEGKNLYVCKFVRKSERMETYQKPTFTNLYVKNLGEDMTEDCLQDKFSEFGKVSNVVIMKNGEGKSKEFGFVNFETPEAAMKAMEALNGSLLGSKTLFVGRAQKKAEREELLKDARSEVARYRGRRNASNLYVKNLDASVDDSMLKEHFSSIGTITSARVMRNPDGSSRGFGFVCYTTSEEARRALVAFNGITFRGKPLYVAMAQQKEERIRLQNSFGFFPPQLPGSCYWNSSDFYAPPFLNYSVLPLPQPPVPQLTLYQHYGANTSFPFGPLNNKMNYSTYVLQGKMPMHDNKFMDWAYKGQSAPCLPSNLHSDYQDRGLLAAQRLSFGKKGSKQYRQAESGSAGLRSTRSRKPNKNLGNAFYPLVENMKPEHDWTAVRTDGWGYKEGD
ncbi:polyadenylate-binding protein 6-like isoform X2 [Punica granatum]|uniref:Polyadenylate-binding protein 6-like isoform X2 n=1 Tax=Punica granatum TaxID=22663 RepID=A0A218WX57_PUNGR|nr:polyadenylate-binding protein 6-like isoform X2 [Punica granatum]OWM77099.1 hypothetical protein CDL15_Pgr013190 [Punica granatum]